MVMDSSGDKTTNDLVKGLNSTSADLLREFKQLEQAGIEALNIYNGEVNKWQENI